MKMNREMIERIREIVDEQELYFEYGYIGVRVQEESFELGTLNHCSHIWDDGEDTGEELDGVCAVHVDHLEAVTCEYYGDHVAIICGNRAEMGEDVGEIIIEDAVVAAIIR